MASNCLIYMVRHGETHWNVERRLQGHADSPLTTRGIREAQRVADELAPVRFDVVYASDLLRARRTAELLVQERKLRVIGTELLRERYFGRYEGQPYTHFRTEMADALAQRDGLVYEQQLDYRIHPEIETDRQVTDRALDLVQEVTRQHGGKSVLMVTHGGMVRSLLYRLGYGCVDGYPKKLHVGNLGYFVLETDGVDMKVGEVEGIYFRD